MSSLPILPENTYSVKNAHNSILCSSLLYFWEALQDMNPISQIQTNLSFVLQHCVYTTIVKEHDWWKKKRHFIIMYEADTDSAGESTK